MCIRDRYQRRVRGGRATVMESVLNHQHFAPTKLDAICQSFKSGAPFKHCQVRDFLEEGFVETLERELYKLKYMERDNDLYQFMQTKDDLRSCDAPAVKAVREVLYSQKVRSLLQKVTGIELNDTVDMSAAVYQAGSHLLCHDDELDGRRIAYILYLVPDDWTEAEGGVLDLYSSDDRGLPTSIAKTVVPMRNSLTFFEVSPTSWHQVREVTTTKRGLGQGARLSISGWFHGEPIARPTPPVDSIPRMQAPTSADTAEHQLADWLDARYISAESRAKVRRRFKREWCIELRDFLREDKFREIQTAMLATGGDVVGPANWRSYLHPPRTECLDGLRGFIMSQVFVQWLTEVTSVEVLEGCVEARQFNPGQGYTLVHDCEEILKHESLDVVLCFVEDQWEQHHGGYINYGEPAGADGEAVEDEGDLVTVFPMPNTISIVLRESNITRFVKLVSHDAPGPRIDIAATYMVKESEEDGEDGESAQEPGSGESDTDSEEGEGEGADSDADVEVGAGVKRAMMTREAQEANPTKKPKQR
eukprot:TRINITY_DN12919_c0_g1_i2.p1 TRINITY_DN12919_c0_g1~~TRINITY_DN12919_c0_g1_i2.p1  ORF type:complete len:533 (-),score=137.88 TRINITY_DN12919_c0_g1_i2:302-1900(-)